MTNHNGDTRDDPAYELVWPDRFRDVTPTDETRALEHGDDWDYDRAETAYERGIGYDHRRD